MNDLLCMDLDKVPVLLASQATIFVDVELTWDPDVPPRLTVVIITGKRAVTWEIGRDLLADGLDRGTAGLGDVSVLPCLDEPHCIELVLSSPSGRAALIIEREDLNMYLLAIERHEHPDRFAGSDAGAAP